MGALTRMTHDEAGSAAFPPDHPDGHQEFPGQSILKCYSSSAFSQPLRNANCTLSSQAIQNQAVGRQSSTDLCLLA